MAEGRVVIGGVVASIVFALGCNAISGVGDFRSVATDDAQQETGSDSGIGEASPCTTTHDFCDDFDGIDASTALSAKWPLLTTSNGGTFDLSTDPFVSSPNAFAARVSATDGGISGEATLIASLSRTTLSSIDCSFDLWLDSIGKDPTDVTSVFRISIEGASTDPLRAGAILLSVDGTQALIGLSDVTPNDGGVHEYPGRSTISGLPVMKWTHVTLHASPGAASSISFSVDGGTPVFFPGELPTAVSRIVLTVGLFDALHARQPWRVLYDDVVCDVPR